MMRIRRFPLMGLILAIGMFVAVPGVQAAEQAFSPEYGATVTAARETTWKAITKGMGSGANIAIMDRGEIVYSEGLGVADRAENRPVDRNTRFNIGSVSKMFTAVAILLLVDEGKVGLDESVAKYIPEFTMKDDRFRDITLRMLFNHSSGLPGSSFYFGYEPDGNMHRIMLETLSKSRLKHAPGAMSIYCNDGFTLAEIVVERVSGLSFIDFLAERVFRPLGMKNTGTSVGEIGGTNVAEFYATATGKRYPREVVSVYGAGGLSSTAEDMARFGDSLTFQGAGRLLSDASLKELVSTQPTPFSDKLRGRQMMSEFGWEYTGLEGYRERGIRVLGKGGNTMCYSSNLQVLPDEQIVIAFNISGNASGEALTRPILDALMRDRGLLEEETPGAERPLQPEPIPSDLLSYAGYYTNGPSLVEASLDTEQHHLVITPLKPGPSMSFLHNGGSFHNYEKNLEFYFTTVEGIRFIVMRGRAHYPVHILVYQGVEPVEEPLQLNVDLQEIPWLLRNAPPYIQPSSLEPLSMVVQPLIHEDLPGYVDFAGLKRIDGQESAAIAATAFRDQAELSLVMKNGSAWVRHANFLFSAADRFGTVENGETIVRIGEEGFNQWLNVKEGAVLRFETPPGGRVIVTSKEGILFDTTVDSDEIYVPAGNYLFFAGGPGDFFRVHAQGDGR